jgi:hypothetical protein
LWTSPSTTDSGVHDKRLPHTSDTEERVVYTVAEAGEMFGISRAFAYELLARGDLHVIRHRSASDGPPKRLMTRSWASLSGSSPSNLWHTEFHAVVRRDREHQQTAHPRRPAAVRQRLRMRDFVVLVYARS